MIARSLTPTTGVSSMAVSLDGSGSATCSLTEAESATLDPGAA